MEKKMNAVRLSALLLVLVFAFAGCSDADKQDFELLSQTFDFSMGREGWEADYTDYPFNNEIESDTLFRWSAGVEPLPAYLGGQTAFKVSTRNVSGSVFMFIKRKVAGFKANSSYTVGMEIELASDAIVGQGVILKSGASDLEPRKIIENGQYTLNVDKGSFNSPGENAVIVGEIGTSHDVYDYTKVVRSNTDSSPLLVKSNSKGEIWLLIGTESSYVGTTTVYFTKVNAVFSLSQQSR